MLIVATATFNLNVFKIFEPTILNFRIVSEIYPEKKLMWPLVFVALRRCVATIFYRHFFFEKIEKILFKMKKQHFFSRIFKYV